MNANCPHDGTFTKQNPGIGVIAFSETGAQYPISSVAKHASKIRDAIQALPPLDFSPLFSFEFVSGKLLFSHLLSPFQKVVWLGPVRCFRSVLACVIIAQLLIVSASAQISEKEILQNCRAALIDLQRAREVETNLRAKITELEAADRVSQERMKALETAVTKYEAAIAARTQAEILVSELRSNYQQQIANAEKQLAIEQGKTSFWRTMAKVGLFGGLLVGAAIGYVIGNQ